MNVLQEDPKRFYEWYRTLQLGQRVSREELLAATGWQDSTLRTYLSKNKLLMFFGPCSADAQTFDVGLEGDAVTEDLIHEQLTQKSS